MGNVVCYASWHWNSLLKFDSSTRDIDISIFKAGKLFLGMSPG